MKKKLKGALSLLLCMIMVFGAVAVGGSLSKASGSDEDIVGEIISFGSYPQTKVTKSTLKAALGEQAQDADGNVEYAGERYLRCKVPSGSTEFYKYEPIQWRILSNGEDGLFVLSEKTLDCKPFNSSNTSCLWSASTVRKWLNNNFYDSAFNASEKAQIRTSTIITDGAPGVKEGDVDTKDKVFLLSYYDASNVEYGMNNNSRRVQPSDYAAITKSYFSQQYWLRTQQSTNSTPFGNIQYYVNLSGDISTNTIDDMGFYLRPASGFGIRPAIKLYELPEGTRFITDEEYTQEHVSYDSQKYDSFVADNGFYNTVWSDEQSKRLWAFKTWDVVGDIGEIATFKFDDLTISADYYQLFLADLIMMINNSNSTLKKDINLTAFELYNKHYGAIEKILKTTDEWKKSITTADKELEIKGFFTDPDYKLSEGTEAILRKILQEGFDENADSIKKIFNELNKANDIVDYILKGADIVKAFKTANDAYTAAVSFKTVNSEIFNILYSSATEMEKTNRKYADWFRGALNKYYAMAMDDNEILAWSLSLTEDMAWMTYDLVLKKHLQNWSYNMLSKVLGCDPGVLGKSAFWVTFSYNTTYKVLNTLLPMGKASTPYYFMAYVAPFENALGKVVKSYGNKLQRNKTYENAKNYDFAFSVLKATNTYLYECSFDFCSAQKEKEDMKYATFYKKAWVDEKCHSGILRSDNTKYVSVQCPVDVNVYDKANNLVLSIINDIIVECDPSITVMNYDGKKSFCYSSDDEYKVEISARTNGKMDYYVTDFSDDQAEKDVEFYDIAIKKREKFSGSIPAGTENDDTAYKLKSSDGEEISCNYSSESSSNCNEVGHKFGDWEVVNTPTCFEYGVEKRICSVCQKAEFRGVGKKHGDFELKNYQEANCTADGYSGDKYCKNCEELVEMGKILPATGHTWSEWTVISKPTLDANGTEERVCGKCKEKESKEIPKLDFLTMNGKFSINTPSVTTVSYGFTLNLHANVTDLPEGARIVWSMDGSGFELIPSADGMTCGVKSVSKGSATITAKVVDKNGNAVKDANGNEITASQQLTSKAGFFQKLVAFFKKLFGSNMVIPSSLNKLIK